MGISLIAGIAIPAMVIGIPVYVGRKVSVGGRKVFGVFSVLSRNSELIGRVDPVIEPKFSFLF